ncbi:MAG: phosphoribosylanthranilate isomerase [Lachnospiraceae bacterium]|nr:phosphoribosylanthranilate isomerase [Lachnospiraceae bacterium]
MTKIKLCGLSRPQDIEAANALAPDYIGFVFAEKSRRYVTPERARELRKLLKPGIAAVGVFVDAEPESVAGLLREGIIDIAQLHGAEDEVYIRRLRELTDRPIIKAFRLGDAAAGQEKTEKTVEGSAGTPAAVTKQDDFSTAQEEVLRAAAASSADIVLLDSGAGTGMVLNWERLAERKFPREYILAGGLTPENVGEAIRSLHPMGVDVSSGIESEKVKDESKMAAFVDAVRDTQEEQSD